MDCIPEAILKFLTHRSHGVHGLPSVIFKNGEGLRIERFSIGTFPINGLRLMGKISNSFSQVPENMTLFPP